MTLATKVAINKKRSRPYAVTRTLFHLGSEVPVDENRTPGCKGHAGDEPEQSDDQSMLAATL